VLTKALAAVLAVCDMERWLLLRGRRLVTLLEQEALVQLLQPRQGQMAQTQLLALSHPRAAVVAEATHLAAALVATAARAEAVEVRTAAQQLPELEILQQQLHHKVTAAVIAQRFPVPITRLAVAVERERLALTTLATPRVLVAPA
jgi:hypothetical protein